MIPDVFDQNTALGEKFIALPIVLLLAGKSVSGPIQFDAEFSFKTIEIEEVWPFRVLSAEFISGQPS